MDYFQFASSSAAAMSSETEPLTQTLASSPWPTSEAAAGVHLRVPAEEVVRSSWQIVQAGNRLDAIRSDELVGPFVADSERTVRNMRRKVAQEVRRRGRNLKLKDVVDDVFRTAQSDGRRDGPLHRLEHFEASPALAERQTAAQSECYTGNENLACYPTTNTTVVQDHWGQFIWNKNYPSFTNDGGYVDIFLFHQDSDQLLTSWTSVSNYQGRISFQPVDSWWQGRTAADNLSSGQNLSWPFYFAITSSGKGFSLGTSRLATWYAVQTALPREIAASRSSASAAAVASSVSASANADSKDATARLSGPALSSAFSSLASLSEISVSSSMAASLSNALVSSLRSQGLTSTETARGTITSTLAYGHTITAHATGQANGGSLNDAGASGMSITHSTIALIVVVGFLALVTFLVAAYFLTRWTRRRRYAPAGSGLGMGFGASMVASGSYNSQSSMMRDDASEGVMSDFDETGALSGIAAGATRGDDGIGDSRGGNDGPGCSPFSSDEASRMAEAFRAALRKPGFGAVTAAGAGAGAAAAASGDRSPAGPVSSSGESTTTGEHSETLLRNELASEGRDLRRVQDRRHADYHN